MQPQEKFYIRVSSYYWGYDRRFGLPCDKISTPGDVVNEVVSILNSERNPSDYLRSESVSIVARHWSEKKEKELTAPENINRKLVTIEKEGYWDWRSSYQISCLVKKDPMVERVLEARQREEKQLQNKQQLAIQITDLRKMQSEGLTDRLMIFRDGRGRTDLAILADNDMTLGGLREKLAHKLSEVSGGAPIDKNSISIMAAGMYLTLEKDATQLSSFDNSVHDSIYRGIARYAFTPEPADCLTTETKQQQTTTTATITTTATAITTPATTTAVLKTLEAGPMTNESERLFQQLRINFSELYNFTTNFFTSTYKSSGWEHVQLNKLVKWPFNEADSAVDVGGTKISLKNNVSQNPGTEGLFVGKITVQKKNIFAVNNELGQKEPGYQGISVDMDANPDITKATVIRFGKDDLAANSDPQLLQGAINYVKAVRKLLGKKQEQDQIIQQATTSCSFSNKGDKENTAGECLVM